MGYNPAFFKDEFLSKLPAAERRRLGKAGRTRTEISDKQGRDAEKEIHNQWQGFCFMHNIYCTHARTDRKSTIKKGHLDFACSKNNRVMFIEFKVPPRGLTEEQKQEIDRLRACGNVAVYVIEERVHGAALRLAIELATNFFQLTERHRHE